MSKQNNDKSDKKESSEVKIDPKYVNFMLEDRNLKPSPKVRENLREAVHAHKRKLVAEGKLNNSEWLSSLRPMIFVMVENVLGQIFKIVPPVFRLAVPSFVLIFIISISVAVFYFAGNKNTLPIANNPTPISTSRPIVNTPTPSVAKEVSPSIQKNNKNNVDNINPDNDTNVAKKQKLENKLKENINTLYKKENNKTDDTKDHTKDTIKDEDLISKTYPINITIPTTRTIELINNNMVYIGSFSEDDFDETKKKWLEELHKCLVKEIPSVKSDLEWEVVSAENATISLQIDDKNESVVIVNSKAEDIWRMKITDYIKDSPRVVADRIIQQLQKDINNSNKK